MKAGGKAKLVCPADVAYGERGAPPKIKPGSTLTFDVELLEIVKDTAPATPPKDRRRRRKAKKRSQDDVPRARPGHAGSRARLRC